jgi:tRNA pseudouridine55 synthase
LTEGIVLLDKPAGETSFQSLALLKRRLGTRKVGHAGTLDRFADGLLVVLTGRMTRLCAFATELDKEYVAVVAFGTGTDTLDPEGDVIAKGRVPTRGEVEAILPGFLGTVSQVPPVYSAIHVGGKRAYEAARNGEQLSMPPRMVTIQVLTLLDCSGTEATLRVSCSKGTYIRALARDIAERLGTCAHLSHLRRVRIGGFLVEDARHPGQFDPEADVLPPKAFFDAAPSLGRLRVKPEWGAAVSSGIPLSGRYFDSEPPADGIFGAFSEDDRLVAVIERRGGNLRYAAAFPELPRESAATKAHGVAE